MFVTVQPPCKLEFADHLWLPFLDQPQSDILVSVIITFQIHNILEKNWKHVIGPNDIIPFNEELDLNSTSIIDLVNIHESFHEEVIIILIKNKDLNKTKNSSVTEDYNRN